LDVDGVLTAGDIVYTSQETEIKGFYVRDGAGLGLWRRSGKHAAIVSGRYSPVTLLRAREVGIVQVLQGDPVKKPYFDRLLAELRLAPAQVCFIGDDVPDVPILEECGLACAVSDADPALLRVAHYVTRMPGGRGAVREVIELILKAQGLWWRILRMYRPESPGQSAQDRPYA